jgi:hypothetical protein
MKIKTAILAALLVPALASAQAYDPATGQRFDAYGRPLASVEELCREGQMADGPIASIGKASDSHAMISGNGAIR